MSLGKYRSVPYGRTIGDLAVGECGWAVPWALTVNRALRAELGRHMTAFPDRSGTASLLIARTDAGYQVALPGLDYEWTVATSIRGDLTVDGTSMPRMATLGPATCICEKCSPKMKVPSVTVNTGDGSLTIKDAIFELRKELETVPASRAESQNPVDYLTDEDRAWFAFNGADPTKFAHTAVKPKVTRPSKAAWMDAVQSGIEITDTYEKLKMDVAEAHSRAALAQKRDEAVLCCIGVALLLAVVIGWIGSLCAGESPDQQAADQKAAANKAANCSMYEHAYSVLSANPTPAQVAQMAQINEIVNQIGCN